MMEIGEGKYKGRQVEEPEYELMAAFSCLVGIDDVTTTILLANEVDRLGMDGNETGWIIAWLMECYENGILKKKDLDGLEMRWGDAEAVMSMLHRIAKRQGFGNILAEGIMRASKHVGEEAAKMAIYTKKGNTPRGHDHRVMWLELFDTCVSNLGTLEAHIAAPLKLLGLPENYDPFDPIAISTIDAKIKGAMVFEDSLVTCRFNTSTALDLLSEAVNASTGWSINVEEAMKIGKRAVNLARIFNLRAGIGPELDAPSERYGSTPTDGLAQGKGIMEHWNEMLKNYYRLMGWDEKGKPLPETLRNLDIGFAVKDLPGE